MQVKGLTVDKLDKVTKSIAPRVIADSTKFAMNKTIAKARGRAVKSISNASGVKPAKLIKQRTAIFKARSNRLVAGIYFRTGPMPAEVLAGKTGPKWNRKMTGVTVKGHTFEGAFTGVPQRGKNAGKRKRIYQRVSNTGSNRSDLRAQYIHIERFGPILPKVGERVVAQHLEKEFISQFEFRMKKAGF